MSEWFDELAQFLRIPSISADPEHAGGRGRGRRVGPRPDPRRRRQRRARRLARPAAGGRRDPRVGRRRTRRRRCSATGTSTCSRPIRSSSGSRRRSSPRSAASASTAAASPTTRASSTCCSRGARALAQAGTLPVNVRFACDGEEETGGHSIVEFLEADERGADAAIIFDSGMIREDVPAFNIATRGLVYFHVELATGARDLHSGIYGGAALNAAHALIRTLAPLIAADGRLAEPLRQGIIAPTAQELEDWKQLPARRRRARRAGRAARRSQGRRGVLHPHHRRARARRQRHRERLAARCEKTVLPVRAAANVSVRLAPGQDPDTIAAAFEQLIRDAAPAGRRARRPAAGPRRGPGSCRPTRARSSSGRTPSSACSACARR